MLITKDDVESIVSECIKTVMVDFQDKLTKLVNSKLESLNTAVHNIEKCAFNQKSEIDGLAEKHRSLDIDLTQINKKLDELPLLKERCKNLEQKMSNLESLQKNTAKMANHNEQYSRRNNIRIRGLGATKDETCEQTVIKFLNNRLNLRDNEGKHVQISVIDIDAAHPIQSRRSQQEHPPSMIVKFHQRCHRDMIIKARRQLKGQSFTINEDLTKLNQQLLTRLKDSPAVESAWSWNGKILAKVKGQSRPKQFDIYDPIPSVTLC